MATQADALSQLTRVALAYVEALETFLEHDYPDGVAHEEGRQFYTALNRAAGLLSSEAEGSEVGPATAMLVKTGQAYAKALEKVIIEHYPKGVAHHEARQYYDVVNRLK